MADKPTYEELKQRVEELEQVESKHKQFAVKVTDSEKLNRVWLEHSPVCTKIVDLDFNLQYMSSAGIQDLGIEDITPYYGKPYPLDFYPESFRDTMTKNLEKSKETGEIITQEASVVDLKENKVWFHSTIVPIKDKKSRIEYFMIVSIDITEHKQGEEALQRVSRLSEEFINSLPGLFYVFDEQRFVKWNKEWNKVTGYSDKELSSRYGTDFFDGKDRERIGVQMTKVFCEGTGKTEAKLVTKDGRRVPYFFTGLRKNLEGKDHLIGLGIDITNRKQLEDNLRQSQKMESIGTLAGGIAHDFNNILSGIIGYTELSKDNVPKNSPVVNYLNNALKLTNRAGDLVSQILAFSRKNVDEEKPIDIAPILKEALKLLRSTLPSTIEIEKNIDESSAVLIGDPSSIHQIVMNLVTNAAQSIKKDTGIIRISLTSERLDETDLAENNHATPGMFIKLTVQDNGSGIDPSSINHIFDPFFTTKEVGKGTGMGLSVVHGIVTAHGGLIKVNSVLNKGTTFNVFIPKTEMKAIETDIVLPQAIPGTANILFVDDEELLRDITQKTLSSLGYNVTDSSSASEAIKIFEKDPGLFDLVITDLSMPKMNGINLSKELIKLRPEIPVILCTGNTGDISDQSIKDAGIRATVMKPITIAGISKVIFDVLNSKEN